MLLTDTVGFIDRLPTHLIKAFKSTLEEAVFADIIIHLVDAGEPAEERTRKYGVTLRLLEELGISGKPMLEVYNKMDAAVDTDFIPSAAVCISAADGTGHRPTARCAGTDRREWKSHGKALYSA